LRSGIGLILRGRDLICFGLVGYLLALERSESGGKGCSNEVRAIWRMVERYGEGSLPLKRREKKDMGV
jgi:hypothetical protein